MAIAFSVIFMAHIEKQLLNASPYKPLLWKRFIDDIFSAWTISETEINNFINFANSFHTTIKFTHEMSSKHIVFLDTEVFKGSRFIHGKIFDVQTHFKPTETFQYTHFSSCHPLSVKKGFVKGEALLLLRTNSVKDRIVWVKEERILNRSFIERGYPRELVETILAEVRCESRKTASQNEFKKLKHQKRFCLSLRLSTLLLRISKRC